MNSTHATIEFDSVLRNTHARIRAYIAGLGFRSEEVDTIAIEVYREFHANLHVAPSDLAPQSWLKELARTACLDYLRTTNPPNLASRVALVELLADTDTALQPWVASGDLASRLEDCTRQLSGKDRDLIVGRYQREQNLEELAAQRGETSNDTSAALARLRGLFMSQVQD